MTIKQTITSVEEHVKQAWSAIREQGGELPEQLNMANLPAGILSISAGGGKGDLGKFQKAMRADFTKARADFPVGTEFEDAYAGNSNPLIVAQYLDASNNSKYGGAVGAIMVRKYVEPTDQAFGTNSDYVTSSVKDFLDTTYLENCSDSLKSVISDITISCNSKSIFGNKWFSMSADEVGGISGYDEGMFWDYWKSRTGLATANNNTNTGRIMRNRNGTAVPTMLRPRSTNSTIYIVYMSGNVVTGNVTSKFGILPACFIAKP